MGIRRMLERRRVRKAFGEYLSPEVIRRLLLNPALTQPEVKHFQFVVILLEDTRPRELSELVSSVIGTIYQHHAVVTNNTPTLIIALLGAPFPDGNSPEARRELVDELLQKHGARIRIAHGECDGAFGNFGGEGRCIYGAAIPGFAEIVKKLLENKLGTAVEISSRLG